MPAWIWIALACVVALYAAFVLALVALGRTSDVRAWSGFIPDCVVLVRRLLNDPAIPRSKKLLLGAMLGYLALPFDIVPDFIPVAGHLDDAIVVAAVLRSVVRAGGEEPIRRHWPGPDASLRVLLRMAGVNG